MGQGLEQMDPEVGLISEESPEVASLSLASAEARIQTTALGACFLLAKSCSAHHMHPLASYCC